MPFTPEEIDEIIAAISKVRIPELPPFTSFGDLSMDDRLAVWMDAPNKTAWVDLLTVKTLIDTGGAGSIVPVLQGDTIIHVVTAGEAGGDTISLPDLAGKSFFLRMEGRPVLPTEFEILDAGGFRILIAGFTLEEGQRFDLQVYDLQVTSGPGPAVPLTTLLVKANSINVNTLLDNTHINKVVPIRGGATALVLTLPDPGDYENGLIILETSVGNTVQHKIQTSSGNINMNNATWTDIRMSAGEAVWLFSDGAGWQVINTFGEIYRNIGVPTASYKVGLNEIACEGQLLNISDYPRLFYTIQTFGASLVSDATWNTASIVSGNGQTVDFPYRGCFSTGNGTTTFRLPDLRGQFLRGLKTNTGSVDGDRVLNVPGGFQKEDIISHAHSISNQYQQWGSASGGQDGANDTANPITGSTANFGGTHTRPDNVGVKWVIKY